MLKRIYGLRNGANYAEWHFYLSGHFRRTYKALPHRLLIVGSKNVLKNISLYCLILKLQCSVLWHLLYFADKCNVKIHSFGYHLGPLVITLEEANTMFLAKRSQSLLMRFFITLFLWIQNAKISQTLVQGWKNDELSIDQKFLSKYDLK